MINNYSTVCMVGLGYIGLPTAAILASKGVNVIGVDIDPVAVDKVNRGEIHIVEPGLESVVKRAVNAGTLRATFAPETADAFLIAVPTPFTDDHQADMTFVNAAVKSIAPVLEKDNLVVLESTSPVGTTSKVSALLAELRPDLTFPGPGKENVDVNVAYCPERVLPGRVIEELVENSRIVGGMSEHCSENAVKLYKTFVTGDCIVTNADTAEMCKLTENTFRDVNIAFANELELVCGFLNVNVWDVIRLANLHPRVNILQPGPGVGGHCIAVDPWFIISEAPDHAKLIRQARDVNESKPKQVVEKVKAAAAPLENPTIACLGLSFKPNIDDLRESPALAITEDLAKQSVGTILVVEPNIARLPDQLQAAPNVEFCEISEAMHSADIIVMLVDHEDFFAIKKEQLEGKLVIDTRGVWG